MFDTLYNWMENHIDEVDNEIRRIYPLLIENHCPCKSCTKSAMHRIIRLLDTDNFHPAINEGDALYLLT
jgi:hypothetical protein